MAAICGKCGRDCRTRLALGKHEGKCEGLVPAGEVLPVGSLAARVEYSNRHGDDGTAKCPRCNEIFKTFLKLGEETWVCLTCGAHFTPKHVLARIRGELCKK